MCADAQRRGQADGNGAPLSEELVEALLDACAGGGIQLAFHVEPYEGRIAQTVRGGEERLRGLAPRPARPTFAAACAAGEAAGRVA